MSSTSRAWMVAVSVGVVEVLKDQAGICRWNYALRSIHQHTKNNVIRSFSQAKRVSSPAASSVIRKKMVREEEKEKMKQSEESLRKVMYLSCWGPNC
ncbi:Protein of unknown function wound-induced [Macleaya cordata]|uniref:Wound-responsive family protein n=1 Tax=Macleaya cordata TaxID=56857 RepID=A0A200QC47_MACCD|nr:Protein of unknown function wound-induced [Macleaya cordata]